ncbi:type II toxin-antitoxin system HicA family toxin [Pseudomonas sp. URMO17WK12:I4]|uniref:type II toxin-antitoxin system HicA family toxin n=1 Tax=Pseudomonas sp. URMO17WK12:I4 TaxID=1283292 RepID=UPI000688D518|nr:type II toxin-antitoxin system HicA family toxin [Pseudomonas sp. URMO17WK12:I4]
MRQVIITTGRRCGKSLLHLLIYAANNGWTARRTRGGHVRFQKPGRPLIHTSSTPSDWRAYRNALAMLVRADRAGEAGRG